MPDPKQTWQDNNAAYPVSAARMNNLEDRVYDAQEEAEQGDHRDATWADANASLSAEKMLFTNGSGNTRRSRFVRERRAPAGIAQSSPVKVSLAWLMRDAPNWSVGNAIEVIVRTDYYAPSYTRSAVIGGYNQPFQVVPLEIVGPNPILPKIGSETVLATPANGREAELYMELPGYAAATAEIITDWFEAARPWPNTTGVTRINYSSVGTTVLGAEPGVPAPSTQVANLTNARSWSFVVNGDYDFGYEVSLMGYINLNGDSSDQWVRMRPNGDSAANYAGMQHRLYVENGGTRYHEVVDMTLEGQGGNGFNIATVNWGSSSNVIAKGQFFSRVGGHGAGRPYQGSYTSRPDQAANTRVMRQDVVGYWNGTARVASLNFQLGPGANVHFTGRCVVKPMDY